MSSADGSQILKICAATPDVLETLVGNLDTSGARPGTIRRTARVGDLGLDPITAAMTAYEVMIVITKIGAAVQLVDWILKKARAFKSPSDTMTITAGTKSITITGIKDINELRQLLGVEPSSTEDT
jgi:hypothetical protein